MKHVLIFTLIFLPAFSFSQSYEDLTEAERKIMERRPKKKKEPKSPADWDRRFQSLSRVAGIVLFAYGGYQTGFWASDADNFAKQERYRKETFRAAGLEYTKNETPSRYRIQIGLNIGLAALGLYSFVQSF